MKKSRKLYDAQAYLAFFLAPILLSVACLISRSPPLSIATPTAVQETASEIETSQTVSESTTTGEPLSPTPQTTSQAIPQPDGLFILKKRCSQCHMPEMFQKINQSRSEWETALLRMQTMGVTLDEPERSILLDYLVAQNNP